jgi:hypothetical protein
MFRPGKWALVGGFAIGMLVAQRATASLGFQPISQDELKMSSEPQAPGAPAIILYRQVDRDDNWRSPHEDSYLRIKILTEEGRNYGNVEIPFIKGQQNIIGLRARIAHPDGSVIEFTGQPFEKELVKGKGVKYLAKTFTLPDVQIGSIIEYSYTVLFNEAALYDSVWILSDELFTKRARFSLRPTDNPNVPMLRWSWHLLPPGTTPPKQGPDHYVRMEASNIPAFASEDYMPPADELKSRVDFVYEGSKAEKEESRYWNAVGKQWNGFLEDYVGKHKAMERAVAQIVLPGDSEEVKLRKIYSRVQQIRNTSYELQKTAQEQKREKEKWEENVEDVWKRGYGNEIQINYLFVGLARAAGFETYACWVAGRREYFFSPATMQSAKLDSSVVLVKLNGKDLYLNPGVPYTPFGLLAWAETGVAGLKVDKDGGTWIETTLPPASESRIERVGKLQLSDAGDLAGRLTVTYVGLEAMDQRLEERHADEAARKKYLEDDLKSQLQGSADVELVNNPDWTASEAPLVAEFKLKIPAWAVNAGRRAMIPAAVFTAGERGVFEHAQRTHPIYFAYPYLKADDLTIDLPPGWQVGSVPPPLNQDRRGVLYTLKVELSPGSVRLTRKIAVDFTLLDAKYYPALRNFFQMVRTGDEEQIVLEPGEIHASN